MPTGIGTLSGLIGSYVLFDSFAQPTCVVGTTTLSYTCMETPVGSLGVVEFCGLGMVVGTVLGLVIGLVVKSRQ
jgi:hypothetical protein